MAARKKAKPAPIKASESVIAGMVCKIVGIPDLATIEHVLEVAAEHDIDALTWVGDASAAPWLSDVAADVMSEDPGSPLIDTVTMREGHPFFVKDSRLLGRWGVWVVAAGESTLSRCALPVRKIENHFQIGGDVVKVTAIQLCSCLRFR